MDVKGPHDVEAAPELFLNLLGYGRREVPFIARPLFNPNPPSQAPSSPPLPTYPVAFTLAPQRAAPCHVRCRAPAPASITFAFTPTCGVRVVSASERDLDPNHHEFSTTSSSAWHNGKVSSPPARLGTLCLLPSTHNSSHNCACTFARVHARNL